MFKKAMLNLMYNIGMFASVVAGYLGFDKRSYVLVLLAVVALVFFLMQKIKLLKEIRKSQKP